MKELRSKILNLLQHEDLRAFQICNKLSEFYSGDVLEMLRNLKDAGILVLYKKRYMTKKRYEILIYLEKNMYSAVFGNCAPHDYY